MIESYVLLDSTEIVNHTRLQAYADNGYVTSLDSLEACGCESLTPYELSASYVSPESDPAPWYDPQVDVSAEFAGLLVLSMTGMDDHPTSRSVTQAVTGGGVFGRQRVAPRTIVVQGVLLGSSCCGVAYGLKWLASALDACSASGCDGADLQALACCPPVAPTAPTTGGWDSGVWDDGVWDDEFGPVILPAWLRTMRRTALISGPTVTRRAGSGCSATCSSDVIFVEFVLSAAEPWQWTTPVEVLSESVPTDAGGCIEWVEVAEGCPSNDACCRLASCTSADGCADPECAVPTPPAVASPQSCYCLPLAVNSTCTTLDTSSIPAGMVGLPIIEVYAGASDLRRVTVSIYEQGAGTCDEAAVADRCDPVAVYHAGFVPAGGRMTFDGQIRRTITECEGASYPASDAWGFGGSPVEFVPLGCDRTYCLCIEADALSTPGAGAKVVVSLSGRDN